MTDICCINCIFIDSKKNCFYCKKTKKKLRLIKVFRDIPADCPLSDADKIFMFEQFNECFF